MISFATDTFEHSQQLPLLIFCWWKNAENHIQVQSCREVRHLWICRRMSTPLELSCQDFVLQEDAEVHAKRAQLHDQLNRLQIAQQKIGKIHEAVCTETRLQKDLLGLAPPNSNSSCYSITENTTEDWSDLSSSSASGDSFQPGELSAAEVGSAQTAEANKKGTNKTSSKKPSRRRR